MDKFGDYMFFLLHAPLRKIKAGTNQLKIFFAVAGELFDGMLQDIFRFRKQKMIPTAELVMLDVIGRDRDMYRYQGESIEQYRIRLQNKAVIAEMGGTNTGLLRMLALLGYQDCSVEPLYRTDRSRWAEIYIDIPVLRDINYDAILSETLKVKPARTLPYFRFYITFQAEERIVAVGALGNEIKVKAYLVHSLTGKSDNSMVSAGVMHTEIHAIKKN